MPKKVRITPIIESNGLYKLLISKKTFPIMKRNIPITNKTAVNGFINKWPLCKCNYLTFLYNGIW